ncbi:MAG: hypothetical protein QM754_02375 [Tepidisphaeraceae bacterium]
MEGTLTSDYPRYRNSCYDLVRHAPAAMVRPEWRRYVGRAMEVTAEQIRQNAAWMREKSDANPDPFNHVRKLMEAGLRVAPNGELNEPAKTLRDAVAAQPAGEARDTALKVLDAMLAK